MTTQSGSYLRSRLVWSISGIELDEASWRLRVHGQNVDIERKPMELLLALLHRAGEVVTKEELLETAWPNVTVVASSLPTAMTKLRRALGTEAGIVETVPGLGYRIAGDVALSRIELDDRPRFAFAVGNVVPDTREWRFARNLARGDIDDVWLAQTSDGEKRVFKFAKTPGRLRQLKREAAVGKILGQLHNQGQGLVLPIDQQFEGNPAWLAFPAEGIDLENWFVRHGAELELSDRISLVAQAARALEAAHAIGVLHGDLKPSNLTIETNGNTPHVRIIDFGSSALLEHSGVLLHGITGITLPERDLIEGSSPAGSALYLAPEVIGGGTSSVRSDIYSLGLILFQLTVGDLHSPLAPGWGELVADDVLRADIAKAAALDPGERFGSAAEFADHLERIEERRADAAKERAAAEAEVELHRAAELAKARRPWVVAAVIVLVVGSIAVALTARQAITERDEARRQTAIAKSINTFLAEDLLGRGDPSKSGEASETLIDATRAAEPEIARRFRNAPLVAAHLYATLARVYAQQSDWKGARDAFGKADRAYRQGHAGTSKDAVIAKLQEAQTEALSAEKGSIGRARAIIAEQEKLLPTDPHRDPETRVWLASAIGMTELAGGDIHVALEQFGKAANLADILPEVFDQRTRNNFHQRYAFTFIRLGEGKRAEQAIHPLLASQTRLLGPANPDVLLLRMNLGQAYLFQKRYADAIKELSAVLPLMQKQLGPDHRLVQQTLAARQEAYGSMGDYVDAIGDGRALYASALRQQGMAAFRTIAGLSDLATSECRTTQLSQGLADALKAYRASLQTYGKAAPLTQGVALAVAQCLIATGRYDSALPYLIDIDTKAVGELASDPQWGANVELALGQIAAHEGNWIQASEHLRSAGPALSKPDADIFQRRAVAQLKSQVERKNLGERSKVL
ncbi:tetratricopeptide repeat protein [Porphyrobacter algicida]|uniref:Tetratricopeptide repeat protein n=1 Tax=Qipengyuania algicida TaxID=1836209 RepID=A0A845AKM6_9SPHN|nr:winged helix-turn-helix domain-containing protein [Qipengyuania algicida]MXP29967.1 tetratricopeptide repeat protein [Qipengyuania algicida]